MEQEGVHREVPHVVVEVDSYLHLEVEVKLLEEVEEVAVHMLFHVVEGVEVEASESLQCSDSEVQAIVLDKEFVRCLEEEGVEEDV